jgi:hypothetical protein
MLGKILKGVGNVLKAASGLMNVMKNFMQSPLGGLLASVFPPAGMMMGGMNFLSMFNSLSNGLSGGQNY